MPENERCTAQEYVDGDSELLTCNMDDGRWEEVFMSNSQNDFIQGGNY